MLVFYRMLLVLALRRWLINSLLNYNLMRSTHEDFMRIETLCAANDLMGNLIDSLPMFKLWNLMDKLLADADGQKLATSESTIQSRYSKKYLGKSPGLSIYT